MGKVGAFLKCWPSIGRRVSNSCAVALDQLKFCADGLKSLKGVKRGDRRCVFDTALNPDASKGQPVLSDEVLTADGWLLMVAGRFIESILFRKLTMTGTDTSATTLTFGVWYLLNNPGYMQKLRDELDAAIPFNDDLSIFEKGWVELEKLKYLVSLSPIIRNGC